MDTLPFINRLRKNARHWNKWARRRGISCYRIYDRDIPEFPLAIDSYEEHIHAQVFSGKGMDESAEAEIGAAICEALEVPEEQLSFKTRQRQKGLSQYEKTGEKRSPMVVHEAGLAFEVDLYSYLDTGLFLDHRNTRGMVRDRADGRRFLNLFAYTGSFSVYAAAGGAASSVTVDLSNTYQEWSRRNFDLNGMDVKNHRLVRADVFKYLDAARSRGERFDLIVLDPPSFSNSKKMQQILDVQRDQMRLVTGALELLNPGGELFFSNNRRRFKLDAELQGTSDCREITRQTVPEDFHRHVSHRCWHFSV